MISHTTEHSVITQPTRNNRPLVVASFDKIGFHTLMNLLLLVRILLLEEKCAVATVQSDSESLLC